MLDFRKLDDHRRPVIIAHRGASKAAHENTLEAFKEAIRMGADAIEFDVRRTVDGVLIIHHNLLAPRSRRRVGNLTYEQLLTEYRSKGIHLPTLEEALLLCSGKIALDIELKEAGYEEDIMVLVDRYFDPKHVVFTSFLDSAILHIKHLRPQALTGLLIGLHVPASFLTRSHQLLSLSRIRRSQADFVAPSWKLVQLGYIRRMRAAGIPVVVWTVDRVAVADKLAGLGVAGIISNQPDVIRAGLAP